MASRLMRSDVSRDRSRWPTTRHTSHQFTLSVHEQSGRRTANVTDDGEELDQLADIVLNKTLKVYFVSPLSKFSNSKRFLRSLSRKIGLQMQKVGVWSLMDNETDDVGALTVRTSNVYGPRSDFMGILVVITKLIETEGEDTADKVILWGVLCNPNMRDTDIEGNEIKHLTNLPLLLLKGSVTLKEMLIIFFSQQFNCIIKEFNLPPMELSWLAAMWAGYPAEISRKPLQLKYVTPGAITGITSVTVKVEAASILRLWNSIHDENSDEFRIEEVKAFSASLNEHIYHFFKLHITSLILAEIHTTSVIAASSGMIKMFSSKTSLPILRHIISLRDFLHYSDT